MWESDFYWMLPNVSVTQKSVVPSYEFASNCHKCPVDQSYINLYLASSGVSLEAVIFKVFGFRFRFRIGVSMRFSMRVFICLPIIHLQFVLKILWKSKSLEQGQPVVEGVWDSIFWDRVSLRCNTRPSVWSNKQDRFAICSPLFKLRTKIDKNISSPHNRYHPFCSI